MKKIFILSILIFNIMANAQNSRVFRNDIIKAESNKSYCKKVYDELDNIPKKNSLYKCYFALANFFMARNVINPIKKLNYFNKGKVLMEQAIHEDPESLELRFYRLIIQKEIPSILGYNKNVSEDQKFVLNKYKITRDEDLKKRIINYLNTKK